MTVDVIGTVELDQAAWLQVATTENILVIRNALPPEAVRADGGQLALGSDLADHLEAARRGRIFRVVQHEDDHSTHGFIIIDTREVVLLATIVFHEPERRLAPLHAIFGNRVTHLPVVAIEARKPQPIFAIDMQDRAAKICTREVGIAILANRHHGRSRMFRVNTETRCGG